MFIRLKLKKARLALNGRLPQGKRSSGTPLRIVLTWSWGRIGAVLGSTLRSLGSTWGVLDAAVIHRGGFEGKVSQKVKLSLIL